MEELIRNAIEHTDADDPKIHVSIDSPKEAEGILVTVEDDGPGIPDKEIAVLSADEETPLEHSEGIGLWMVTWIVDAADGEITFEDSFLGGTCIRWSSTGQSPQR
jgi:signal transduction histidine kinase